MWGQEQLTYALLVCISSQTDTRHAPVMSGAAAVLVQTHLPGSAETLHHTVLMPLKKGLPSFGCKLQ